MRRINLVITAVLFLLLGTAAYAHASSTMAIGSHLSIRGRKIGLTAGTKPTTYILITPTMGTTSTTGRAPASGSQLLSRS